MPFRNEKQGFIYTSIVNGKFAIRAKEDDNDPEIIERTNAEGKKVREYHYSSLSDVYLADIQVETHDTFGKSWCIYLLDGHEYVLWRVSAKGALGSSFLKMVENIQLDKKFTLVPGWDKEKERSQIFINQDGQWLKSKYPRPKEGETSKCPPGEPKIVNDETVWDYSKQNRFLYEMVQTIRPFLPGINRNAQQVAKETSTPPPGDQAPPTIETNAGYIEEPEHLKEESKAQPSSPPEEDDLPF